MNQRLERLLAYHCAPALVGMKPSNLIACYRRDYPNLDEALKQYHALFSPKGIELQPLCQCSRRVLLLVYRNEILERHLNQSDIVAYLRQRNYPVGSTQAILKHLEERLSASREFPHEMGIILGYPIEDVEGFLCYAGKYCKLSGYWKVYGDKAKAKRTFAAYNRCRSALTSLVESGVPLATLLTPIPMEI